MSPLIAFHLPQFHAIPENDAWWGDGFTEWTNVRKAKPLYKEHYQPHVPLEHYNLLDPDVRNRQAQLAKQYGINAFCYYHFWFNGRRLLEKPVNAILSLGEPDFPFCLCWANEPWTRAWDGGEREILMPQNYSDDDDRLHIEWLMNVFRDPRYFRIDGKPLFLIYRAAHMSDPKRTTDIWRAAARAAGLGELHLARVESFHQDHGDPRRLGFDAAVEFAPDRNSFAPSRRRNLHALRLATHHFRQKFSYRTGLWLDRLVDPFERFMCSVSAKARATRDHFRLDYRRVMEYMLAKPEPDYVRYRGIFPGWDNTARRKTGAVIVEQNTPELYESWLKTLIQTSCGRPIFINAWNEWAEGCHLEPDARWGHAFLEATARAVS